MFTIRELIDVVIMTLAIGYIFSTFIRREPVSGYDPISYFKRNPLIEDIKHGIVIAAPAVVLHEFAHKFSAMAFGATAVLHAPINWYIFVIILRMLNFPFLFFVGGYVAHTALPPLESAIVAVSGPLTNIILFGIGQLILRYGLVNKKYYRMVGISAKLNLFLAGFNMIPIPGFDGYHFFTNIARFLF